MSGYIGKGKSVVNVASYTKAQADDEFVNDPNSVISVSGSNVGIGTSSPVGLLDLEGSGNASVNFSTTNDYGAATINILAGSLGSSGAGIGFNTHLRFGTVTGKSGSLSEKMRIDSSGNLLVGTTSSTPHTGTSTGVAIRNDGGVFFTRANADVLNVNRTSSDGAIAQFRKDGSTVGSIGTFQDDLTIGTGDTGLKFSDSSDGIMPFNVSTNAFRDNAIDLGHSSVRFDDIYATNGTIQTSDRNEKQDIEALSDAEQRVAVACKGLLRKFRWIDSVAEKGDAARIHFGIIAQDLQDAFAAEGLDAGRYAMFISTTWWETQTDVPAAEAVAAVYEDVVIPAVLDEDGNEVEAERTEQQLVTEAVEAKEAYTRTDTYETLEEAPEGATERTRLGVRYPELLAFIIGAM